MTTYYFRSSMKLKTKQKQKNREIKNVKHLEDKRCENFIV